jgi:hypothetical protein
MDFCHRSHIIHGDMKLAQVLLKRPIDPQPLSHHAKVSNNASAVHIKVAGASFCFDCVVFTLRGSCSFHHMLQILETAVFVLGTVWIALVQGPAGTFHTRL